MKCIDKAKNAVCYDVDRAEVADIVTRLDNWRAERHLDKEGQFKGFLGNFYEEVSEYYRAQNDYERIDALCDMLVFALNALPFDIDDFEGIDFRFFANENGINRVVKNSIASILHVVAHKTEDNSLVKGYFMSEVYVCDTIILYAYKAMLALGFNPYLCMCETLKEIESHTGKYDESIGKFVKDTSDEAKARWYKADYSKCRLEVR